jgi:hypothetical protein
MAVCWPNSCGALPLPPEGANSRGGSVGGSRGEQGVGNRVGEVEQSVPV